MSGHCNEPRVYSFKRLPIWMLLKSIVGMHNCQLRLLHNDNSVFIKELLYLEVLIACEVHMFIHSTAGVTVILINFAEVKYSFKAIYDSN